MHTRNLLEKRAYIARFGQSLSEIYSATHASRHKVNFQRTIRAMSAWGTYPWKSLNYHPKQTGGLRLLVLLFSVPFRTTQGIIYFALKYLEYSSYRRFRNLDFASKKLGVFSPSLHLSEFTNRSYTGFWGEIKFLDKSVGVNTAWFLIPYKQTGTSNRQIVKEVSRVNQETDFLLIPLAAFFSLKVLSRAILEFITFHAFIAKLLLLEISTQPENKFWSVFDVQCLGIGLSRTELNRHLISSSLAQENQLKNCLHLMEGQSWEIVLNDVSLGSELKCWGVIHTPLRNHDSQILNYLLALDGENLANKMQGICCPGQLTIDSLEELGIQRSQFRLVEAQRFNHYRNTGNFTYSRDLRKVLYVSDANIETTETFAELVTRKTGESGHSEVQFHMQAHPSQAHLKYIQLPNWNVSELTEFGLIVFGPETSSFLQPEFSESNIRIFNPSSEASSSPLGADLMIPQIETLENIEDCIKNQFRLDKNDDSIIVKDLNFKKWRMLIDELLES